MMIELNPQTRRFIAEHAQDDVRTLALQARKYPDVDMSVAIQQIAGRQTIAHKLPTWHRMSDILYPPHLSLEQCSSEATASYKSTLLKGETLVDLTGGFGIDCAFLSSGFRQVAYVEQQADLCDIARHNFQVLGLDNIEVHHRDSVDYLRQMNPVNAIFIDPARRNRNGGKVIAVSDCTPDVEQLHQELLQKADKVLVKLSPMLDLSMALRSLSHTCRVDVVSVQNECKELLLLLQKDAAPQVKIHCINFVHGQAQEFHFSPEEEQHVACSYTTTIGKYLYEPNASILKAGAFKSVASAFRVEKLHPNSHLYTSDVWVANFPGRKFETLAIGSMKDKTLLADCRQVNITTRNFPLSTAEIRKKLKLKEGGEVYLFATTLADGKKVLIKCRKSRFNEAIF